MGLDYSLELVTELQPLQSLRLLVDRLGLHWWDESHLGGPALWISAGVQTARWRALMEEAFHFSPNLSVPFRLDPNAPEYRQGDRLMMRAALLLLEHGQEGALLFNGESIVLQRLKGHLVLNEDFGGWTDGPEWEKDVYLPYERRSLPSPLL